ncbi:Salicylate hydroxylase [Minicystis rosea]|nr:Salicylate hydroxylase [Minicystis rosea]
MIDVIVAGAGPVGSFLARELRLAGVSVLVVEALTERSPHSKALTMNCRSVELFDMRGVADRFLREGVTLPTAHFAALDTRLDLAGLDTRHPYTLVLPQRRTEEILEETARELGAELRFGHRFTGLTQEEDGITVEVASPTGTYRERARFVVGCDGARSAVRTAAGIGFPGTDTTITGFQADIRLRRPPSASSIRNEKGGLLLVKQANGVHRVVVLDPERMHVDRSVAPTADELRASFLRIGGSDFDMEEVLWLSRFGNATRQAEAYRRGRALLAGDAAHIHFPAGGQGMNVGLQDAMNLGWKLAATIHGWAPPGLLDSYHRERHPVGAEVLANTRAQEGLAGFSLQTSAMRALMNDLLHIVPVNRRIAEDVIGLSVAYPPEVDLDPHPLMGRRLPDLPIRTAEGISRVYEKLRPGRFVLLDLACDGAKHDADLARFGDRVDLVRGAIAEPRPELEDAAMVLVRPDGHVAWVGARGHAHAPRLAALTAFCGAPRAVAQA